MTSGELDLVLSDALLMRSACGSIVSLTRVCNLVLAHAPRACAFCPASCAAYLQALR